MGHSSIKQKEKYLKFGNKLAYGSGDLSTNLCGCFYEVMH